MAEDDDQDLDQHLARLAKFAEVQADRPTHWADELTLDESWLVTVATDWTNLAGAIQDAYQNDGLVSAGRFDAFHETTGNLIALGCRVAAHGGALASGFDPAPYRQTYAAAFVGDLPQLQAWLNLAVLETHRIVEEMQGNAAAKVLDLPPPRRPSGRRKDPRTAKKDARALELREEDKDDREIASQLEKEGHGKVSPKSVGSFVARGRKARDKT